MLPHRLLLALCGGLALLFAFPGYDVWPLAVIGCAALALATAGAAVRTGLLAGLLLGLAWYGPMFTWAGTYAGAPAWLAMSFVSALYPAMLGGLLALLQRGGEVRPVVGAAAWVLMEWGRSVSPFGGFPWARLGFSQADSPLLGAASIVGVPGLGFLVALAGGLVAVAAQRALAPAIAHRGRSLAAAVAALVLVVAPVLVPRPTDGEPLTVAAVQGDIPDGFTRTLTAERGTMLRRYTDMTQDLATEVRAGASPYPDLVVWPEGASDLDPLRPDRSPEATSRIMAAVDAVGSPVLVGATSRRGGDAPQNVVVSYLPDRGVDEVYSKVYLAPFGEVMPLRPIMRRLSPWVDRITDFVPGTEPGVMDVPLRDGRVVRLGLGICFEVVVDPAMRDVVRGGAQLLVVPTSNAWFGEGDQSVQHLAASRVRAVELGRSVVHISNVGVSGLITPDGVVHGRSELYTQDLLEGRLPLRTAVTPAVVVGPWVAPAAALLVAGALVVAVVRRGR
ncbi:apolipoprotein N-acyltransferase [Ornithinimicrobium tianjinense]|uniref:Apolipoprotein N-acyltransferase n=1 Tax=Ornithinimicrobium tianjinense TaxID=1195761 RepID=A0A917BKC4_9MICO|nr:apolipoprotein N-acyltransferase [Ornithinimicrobium tianjinense]GGF47361.1 apolipoprotein N-acyltransferase [Ornithinimicrobium tianjinense]